MNEFRLKTGRDVLNTSFKQPYIGVWHVICNLRSKQNGLKIHPQIANRLPEPKQRMNEFRFKAGRDILNTSFKQPYIGVWHVICNLRSKQNGLKIHPQIANRLPELKQRMNEFRFKAGRDVLNTSFKQPYIGVWHVICNLRSKQLGLKIHPQIANRLPEPKQSMNEFRLKAGRDILNTSFKQPYIGVWHVICNLRSKQLGLKIHPQIANRLPEPKQRMNEFRLKAGRDVLNTSFKQPYIGVWHVICNLRSIQNGLKIHPQIANRLPEPKQRMNEFRFKAGRDVLNTSFKQVLNTLI